MSWKLDSDRPIYTQLVEILKIDIVSGKLPPGSKVKSVRDLAMEAGVNPNTMQRAFAELEDMELLRTERTSGRYVTEDKELIGKTLDAIASAQFELFADRMKQLGFSKRDLVDFVNKKVEVESDD